MHVCVCVCACVCMLAIHYRPYELNSRYRIMYRQNIVHYFTQSISTTDLMHAWNGARCGVTLKSDAPRTCIDDVSTVTDRRHW